MHFEFDFEEDLIKKRQEKFKRILYLKTNNIYLFCSISYHAHQTKTLTRQNQIITHKLHKLKFEGIFTIIIIV